MKTYFLLHKNVIVKSDIRSLRSLGQCALILIASKKAIDALTPENRAAFDGVFLLEKYGLPALTQLIEETLINKNISDFQVATNDEACIAFSAKLREHFNLGGPSHKAILPFKNKVVMKQQLSHTSVMLPKWLNITDTKHKTIEELSNDIIHTVGLPLIVKPIDLAGSINTHKLDTAQQLINWLKKNKEDIAQYEFDEFIDGTLYHCDSLIKNGEILFSEVQEYSHPNLDVMQGKILTSLCLPKSDLKNKLLNTNRQVIEALQPPDGATHCEIFIANDEPVFLEIAARTPGAYIPAALGKAFGTNFCMLHYALRMGLTCNTALTHQCFAAGAIFPLLSGKIKQPLLPPLKSHYTINWLIQAGDEISQSQSLLDIAGHLNYWHEDYNIVKHDFELLKQFTTQVFYE